MGWICLLCFLFVFLLSPMLIFSSEDRLKLGMSISGNKTIISAGGTFELGFFNPGNSTNHYLGIWYHKIPQRTVVWVANREVPLVKNYPGTFMLSDEGNLVVFDGRKNVIWSSKVSSDVVAKHNSVGILYDSGNLILRDTEEGTNLWESFNYPSDTILPGMKFGLDLKNGHNNRLISWNKDDDPAQGFFSFAFDPRGPVQMLIWKRSDPYSRTNVWEGNYDVKKQENVTHSSATWMTFSISDEGHYISFSQPDDSLILRCTLDTDGKVKFLAWHMKWILVWSLPAAECELYGQCGPFGLCDGNNTTSICGCMRGFRPFSQKDWDMGDHSAGCVRDGGPICVSEDRFHRFENIKLPDDSISLSGYLNDTECENKCLRNCSCTAYVYANSTGRFTSTCLHWGGKLMDLSTFTGKFGWGINIRLAGGEIASSGKVDKTRHTLTIVSATVAGGIILTVAVFYVVWRRRGRREANRSDIKRQVYKTPGSPNKDTELFSFSFNNILAATGNFSVENKLGEGGFGPVFKGNLPDGEEIAIKRLSKMSGQGVEELMNELTLIAKLQHRNLVKLVGCCIEGEEKMLIYEYMPNKSLDKFLFDPTKQGNFDWNERYHVIEGVAQGLLYLHKYSRVKIIHRDLKASNILLDGAMNPKISDFGMARIFGGNQSQAKTQKVVGTYGYMSPEYALNGLFSEKSDVYSFGVLLIEILTGEKNSGFCPTEGSLSLLGYAWQLWAEGRVSELMDASIRHSLNSHDEVAKCIHIGLLCVQEDANLRPTMSSVVSMLGNETVNLPAPQAPTFFTRISTTAVVASSSSNFSINEISITDVHAR